MTTLLWTEKGKGGGDEKGIERNEWRMVTSVCMLDTHCPCYLVEFAFGVAPCGSRNFISG